MTPNNRPLQTLFQTTSTYLKVLVVKEILLLGILVGTAIVCTLFLSRLVLELKSLLY